MKIIDRKAAVAAYEERKTPAGIYAVRCASSGQVWVGSSRHVGTQQNGLWFALRLGSARSPVLQEAWRAFGEAEFTYEELERLPDTDHAAYLQAAALKERLAAWRARLSARPINP